MGVGCKCVERGECLNVDIDELKRLAEPLTEFVNKQDPYLSVTVRQGSITVTRDEMCVNTDIPD